MTRIVILGGTGYAGAHIATQAAARGHEVVSVSRSAPESPAAGIEHRSGDVRDDAFLTDVMSGADVVISALSPRGDMADSDLFRSVEDSIARIAQEHGARLGVVGGAGSLLVAEGGPKLVDTPDFPEEYANEPRILDAVLADLRASDQGLDWFYVSPGAGFGSFAPGQATGTYRTGGDVVLSDDSGESFISGADLGVAVVDEIERPAHRRVRFTVAY